MLMARKSAGGARKLPGQCAYTTVTDEGGVSSITPTTANHHPTTQCGGMPTGASADAIDSETGLTGLHMWAITCFMDDVMPADWRES